MDYILTNENDNFSVDVYFTPPPYAGLLPRAIFPTRAKAAAEMRVTE